MSLIATGWTKVSDDEWCHADGLRIDRIPYLQRPWRAWVDGCNVAAKNGAAIYYKSAESAARAAQIRHSFNVHKSLKG